jgi:Acetyltransferases, including N-acetylases of ribosomal proteins
MRKYFMKTSRIGFSTWEKSDFDLALLLWNNPDVTKYISSGGFSEEQIKTRFETELKNMELYKIQYYPLFDLQTGNFIGCCGLKPSNISANAYETGFHLLPDYWGKGIATEVGEAVINYAFNVMKVNEIYAGHNPNNIGSKKVIEKLGFQYIEDSFYEPTGLYHPLYKLTK